MAGGKKTLPAPIDRPLSRAYLREFKGWSTAYPPGISDPTSLREMENIYINRDGAAVIRPGLRNISFREDTPGVFKPGVAGGGPGYSDLVGTHESFYLNDGTKAYLYAFYNHVSEKIHFRVAVYETDKWVSHFLEDYFSVFEWDGLQPFFTTGTTYVKYVQIDNKILALSNNGEAAILFHVGSTKKVTKPAEITMPFHPPTGFVPPAISVFLPDKPWVDGAQVTYPTVGDPHQDDSIISSVAANNVYNMAVWVTLSNELGETGASNVLTFKTQRPLGLWKWEGTAGAASQGVEPNGVTADDGRRCGDQLIIATTGTWFEDGVDNGATMLNVYAMAWSDQSSVPTEGLLIAQKPLNYAMTQAADGWVQIHPGSAPLGPMLPIPTSDNRLNTTDPTHAAQGLVAADRLVLVHDPVQAAVVKWTTNEQGHYLNFSQARGGGYKTLTSGNLQIPACVKLWQNPQSVDTLTVLCNGTDGHSSSYYMAPASVTSQSDNTVVMGFEETTATPGTVSPFGCEVANNALYHPLDDQLMKSTASNYNITHKSMTDQISNAWSRLINKDRIVSCFFDQRLYFLVHNPDGAALESYCLGNEVWVLDLAAEGGSWSRWLVQGVSLRKIVMEGKQYLSLVHPSGVFVFDETLDQDEYISGDDVLTRAIPWRLETNTQGANRAHDAWAHLRRVALTVGNFTGQLRFGVRGKDVNGQVVNESKVYRQAVHELGTGLPFDAEDHLRVAREMKEWFFYAESVEVEGVVQPSYGQLSLVQYSYTPVSVNVGYDWGTVESFEYGRAAAGAASYTDNGVPQPYLDTARP